MKTAEIISVGAELLSGMVVDTNAAYLSRELREAGYEVRFRQTCGDEREDMMAAFEMALSRADMVIVTGGLGPTYDDLTRPVAAEVFGLPLLHDEKVEAHLRSYFERRGTAMSENNLLQAKVPQGATILWNDWGTAPGLLLSGEKGKMALLPGVPSEMKQIFRERLLPLLSEENAEKLSNEVLHFYGISESLLDQILAPVVEAYPSVTIAPYAGGGEIELHLTCVSKTKKEADENLLAAKEKVLSLVGEYCYGEGILNLETAAVRKAAEKGVFVATAESCTGGLLSQRITSVAGASAMFALGLCTYSEKEKTEKLGVKEETLSCFGVYSKECAEEMAEGVAKISAAQIGIGITGIAGPSGGTEKDPVGTVYIAIWSERKKRCERVVLGHKNSSREFIRHLASSKALSMLLALLNETEF